MKLSVATLSVLSAAALAAPNARSRLADRAVRLNRSSQSAAIPRSERLNVNWAGVAYDTLPSGETFNGVSATFVVPTPKKPTVFETSATNHVASTWIGIDGDNCNNLWQAGVDSTIEDDGTISYYAWYEWYPADTVVIDIGSLDAGHVINVNITASTLNNGVVTLENASTGKSFTKAVASTDTLCGIAAVWIEEDLAGDSSVNGFADFGTVTFTKAYATTSLKRTLGPGDSFFDVVDSKGNTLTKSSVSGNVVTIKYL